MSINWSQIYNNPVGQILGDFSPQTFTQVMTEGTATQDSQLQSQLKSDNTQVSAWTTLQADAQTFSGDISTLDLPSTFQALTASTNTANLTAAADASAQAGTYNIYVDQLAQSELDQGQPPTAITSDSTALNLSGSFQIYTGSAPSADITVSSGNSLLDIVNKINQANSGVTATAVQVNGNWTIDVQGAATGSANAIQYVATSPSSGTSSPLYQLGLWNTSLSTPAYFSGEQLQAAQDGTINFGSAGSSSGQITSSTNTFNNVIPGVTLQTSGTGAATVTVGPDVKAMTQSVQQFVDDWNQWVSDTSSLADAGTVNATGSGSGTSYSYQANSNQEIQSGLPQNAINQIQSILAGPIGSTGDLASIGLTFDGSGNLSIDSTTLQNALTANPGAVSTLFQNLYNLVNPGGAGGVLTGFYQGPQSVAGNALAYDNTEVSQLENQQTLMQNQLNAQEQQAIVQYGKWVSQIAQYAQENSTLDVLFNQNSNTSQGG